MNSNLLIILRAISAGENTIFENSNGEYVSKQTDDFQTHSLHKGCTEYSIESRLQFELYGEYPLSEKSLLDYEKNVRPAIKLNS